jgi:hypothetical protein
MALNLALDRRREFAFQVPANQMNRVLAAHCANPLALRWTPRPTYHGSS